jgi:anti-sigma regulatory factor (Ser/Thr protein kinase)
MDIATIKDALDATVLAGQERLNTDIAHIYASDLMSDVLAFGKTNSLLLTGLATEQAIITAHMAEFLGVVLIRGKKSRDNSVSLARQNDLVLMSTTLDMYEACLRIEATRTSRVTPADPGPSAETSEDMLLARDLMIDGSDFSRAGLVSTEIKALLKKIGLDSQIVRRVSISTYEAEMNVVMHAKRAKVHFSVTPKEIRVVLDDEGKGIPNVELAMQEGWSTATEDMRKMGFGSGMGLPNIKRNADELDVQSIVGKGTVVSMRFYIK